MAFSNIFILSTKGGPRMNKPMITAEAAAINTLAAPTSFPARARGCKSGLARSTTISSAVLRNSAIQTMAMVTIKIAQSRKTSSSQKAIKITTTVATAWIQAFCCVLITCHQPTSAFLKLVNLDRKNLNFKRSILST